MSSYRHTGRTGRDGRDLIPHPIRLRLPVNDEVDYRDRFRGAMVGTAVGDALGAPVEGASPADIARHFGRITEYVPRARSPEGPHGTFTDDTEMALCIAHSVVEHGALDPEDVADRFQAWGLVGRGMGNATRAACDRIRDGVPWWAGGSVSAGNGAAMRAAPIGLANPVDINQLRKDAAISAVITHCDPTAVASTIVTAYTVAHLLHLGSGEFDRDRLMTGVDVVLAGVGDPELPERGRPGRTSLRGRLHDAASIPDADPADAFALTHNGAFVLESLPAALWAFLHTPEDPRAIIETAVNGGYDADTVGAMAGAFAGAYHGAKAFPDSWLTGLEFRDGLEGVADDLLALSDLAASAPAPQKNSLTPDAYAPFQQEGERWITRRHLQSAQRRPHLAHDIRLLPHPEAAERMAGGW